MHADFSESGAPPLRQASSGRLRRGSPRPRGPARLIGMLLAVAFLYPAALRAADAPHLERLRLLPPVLLKGEKGDSIEDRMRHYNVAAVSVAVIRDGRILWTEARGLADREAGHPATTDTLFQAGSISKPVAAAGVLREVAAGKLLLDRDVNDYLKSWKVPDGPLTATQKVTLERILSHTAGLTVHGFPGYAAGERVPTVPEILDGKPPANSEAVRVDVAPGSLHRYSGGGYTIAQLAMTDTFGKPFPELLRALVLDPAGMSHSTYEQPLPANRIGLAAAGYRRNGSPIEGKRHIYPEMAAAGLWTTAGDLARFAIAIQKSVRGDRDALLPKPLAARMTTPFGGPAGLGLFVQERQGEIYFLHDGADEGFQAMLVASRDHGYGAAVMVNSDNGVALAQEIVRGLAREYGWKWYPPEIETVTLAASDLASVAGRYRIHGDEAITLRVDNGRLLGSQAGGEFELLPTSRERFVRRDRETLYRAEKTPDGKPAIAIETEGKSALATRMASDTLLPSELLAKDRTEEALTAYRVLFQERPADPGIAEARLNVIGYELAVRHELDKAIALLKLNTELHPDSSNTWDSLAEIYLASGDRPRSLETYRRVLDVLDRDKTTEPALRERLRQNANAKIRELSSP